MNTQKPRRPARSAARAIGQRGRGGRAEGRDETCRGWVQCGTHQHAAWHTQQLGSCASEARHCRPYHAKGLVHLAGLDAAHGAQVVARCGGEWGGEQVQRQHEERASQQDVAAWLAVARPSLCIATSPNSRERGATASLRDARHGMHPTHTQCRHNGGGSSKQGAHSRRGPPPGPPGSGRGAVHKQQREQPEAAVAQFM